jgi:hypothetical protein
MCNRTEASGKTASQLHREWRILELRTELAALEHEGPEDELTAVTEPYYVRRREIEQEMASAPVGDLNDLLCVFDMGEKIIEEGGTDDRRERRILAHFRGEMVRILSSYEFERAERDRGASGRA